MTLTNEQIAILAKLSLKLKALGLDGQFLPEVSEGPVVTLYRFQPSDKTRVSQVENLYKDMAIALGVDTVQVNRIPGESCIGIYVPNKVRKDLQFTEAVTAVWNSKAYIPLCLGIDTMGHLVVEDLASLPHLLIAGTTGGGKSTLLKSILAALEYCKTTEQLQLVLCDPKQVELKLFEKSPHLLHPISYTTKEMLEKMEWLLSDIETRLSTFARSNCVNIEEYNTIRWRLPYVVLVIDELADPLEDIEKDEDRKKTYGKLCEYFLGKIAAKARATGIHIIAATQRPSVKVVEGNIKANFPARISFKLPAEYDSRTILGTSGAEQLLSQGDMLYISSSSPTIKRIHAPFTKKEDIKTAIEMAIQKELVK